MSVEYYVDTSIWMDLLEDRKGYNGEPLGDYALKLFSKIKASGDVLVISDLLIKELEVNYSGDEISGMVNPFEDVIEKINVSKKQQSEAEEIAEDRDLPPGDVLHAILARDEDLILITRDNDFKDLEDISVFYKPEDII